jgi:tRNA pseudouridine13 synthase
VLRFIECDDIIIEDSIKFVKENGFINYFGMQRFGNSVVPTHVIGIQVLKKQWKEVMMNVLKFTLEELRNILNLNSHDEVLDSKNIDNAINNLPNRAIMERKILINLKKTNYSYYNGFCTINKQLQVLYPHAYQSYIFNQSVSERIKLFGLKILIGDIVLKKKQTYTMENITDIIDDLEEIPEQEDQDENERLKENFVDNNEKELDTSNHPLS